MSFHMQKGQRRPQTVAQAIIERIRQTYPREQARNNGVYFWPEPLPTPIPPLVPDPLVLFEPMSSSSLPSGNTVNEDTAQQASVLPMSLHDMLMQRVKQPDELMRVPLGLVDIPENQQRDILWVDLHGSSGALSGGPLFIAGAQNSGKATALQSLLLWLFVRYTPQQLRCIVIDPAHDLDMFRDLPYLYDDDGVSLWTDGESDEQIQQLEQRYTAMLTQRRERFPRQRWDEQSIQHLRAQGRELPLLLLIVSQYHSFADRYLLKETLKNMLLKCIEARMMGTYLALTSAETGTQYVPGEIMAKVGTKIVLFLDEQQRYSLLGRTPPSEPIPGRGMMLKRDRSLHDIQFALPVAGATEQARYKALKSAVTLLASQK